MPVYVSRAEKNANTTHIPRDARKDNMVTSVSVEARLGNGRLHMCGAGFCFQATGCGAFGPGLEERDDFHLKLGT